MIGFTEQAFIDYITPIQDQAFKGIREGDDPADIEKVQSAQGVLRAIMLEAYRLDPKITNMSAQLYDLVNVLKGLLERGHQNAWVHKALQQADVIGPIIGILNALNGTVTGNFKCEQAEANPDHKCLNQCWVCRFPAVRDTKPQPMTVVHGKK